MADYPNITLISQIDDATPANDEVANKLDDSVRQLKNFLKTFLAVAHDDAGAIKTSTPAIGTTAIANDAVTFAKVQNIGTDKVLGRATAGSGDVEELVCTAAGRALLDDADAAAQRTTLGLGTLATKSTVETADLDNDAVDAAKLKDDASTDANRAVTTDHIRDSAVTTAKLAANAVTAAKTGYASSSDASPKLIAGGNSNAGAEVGIGGVLSATISAGNLVFAFATTGSSANTAHLEERKATGTAAGGAVAGTANTRGGWTELDPGDLIGISANVITIKKAGKYLIMASVPAYSVQGHQAYLYRTSGTPAVVVLGTVSHAPPGAQTLSMIAGSFETANANETFEIRQWCELTWATNGKGLHALNTGGTPSTEDNVYSIVTILKV